MATDVGDWSPSDLEDIHAEACHRAIELIRAKAHDYSAGGDVFHNFKLVERVGLCSVSTGILVRMLDKVGRITSLLEVSAQVADEAMEDTLLDLINYTIFLYCIHRKPQLPDG